MANSPDVERDEHGYVLDPDAWTPELADALAGEESLALREEHWIVLLFVREHYAEHRAPPDVRETAAHFALLAGSDADDARERIFEIFPGGYKQQVFRIAGMKRPPS